VIIWGTERKRVPIGKAGKQKCPTCRSLQPCKLAFEYDYSHVYFIFGMVNRRRFLMICKECGTEWKVDTSEVDDAREIELESVPFLHRWGCVVFLVMAFLAVLLFAGFILVLQHFEPPKRPTSIQSPAARAC
jgi:hypothetical protein